MSQTTINEKKEKTIHSMADSKKSIFCSFFHIIFDWIGINEKKNNLPSLILTLAYK